MRGRPRKCDDVAQEFSQMYANGETSATIAKKYNVHPNTVIKYLRELGVPIRKQASSKWSDDDIAALVRLYESGRFTLQELADDCGVSKQWMHTLIRDRGDAKMRSTGVKSKADIAKLALYPELVGAVRMCADLFEKMMKEISQWSPDDEYEACEAVLAKAEAIERGERYGMD